MQGRREAVHTQGGGERWRKREEGEEAGGEVQRLRELEKCLELAIIIYTNTP